MMLLATPTSASPEAQSQASPQKSRLARGALWGVIATIAMSILMIVGMATGAAPMPEPIPKALVEIVVSGPMPLVLGLAVISHLAYGGFWGAALTQVTQRVTLWKGLGLGLFLWLVMQTAVLPLLGWGLFGTAVTPAIAVATLVLHLIYGGVLGWGLSR